MPLPACLDHMGVVSSKRSKVQKYVEPVESDCNVSTKESEWDTMLYLSRFGYGLAGVEPQMHLSVDGHKEREGHTKYEIRCALRLGDSESVQKQKGKDGLQVDALFTVLPLSWSCWRRLAELRELLHEPLKKGLGGAYDANFAETPFAQRLGVSGTSDRLNAWVAKLAECVNRKLLRPRLIAFLLRFLDAPAPEEGEDGMLHPRDNFGKEHRLSNGGVEFRIGEWRSSWQVELKAKLLGLGIAEADWSARVTLRDDGDVQLSIKCREDGHPYVTQVESVRKGQPIHFPVLVRIQGSGTS
eukprot:gb/GFBE01044575.1/.p1 GENE.gb/GFBE01044575.1/~~gb/GFBE01044575.1/.p1  ORF type:complete len:299 (+),score=46.09 gb/GFBE01044575.1/:1-897(+)